MVYKNMLLPMLEYGDVFLSATSSLNRKRLQILQNKGLRCALNASIEVGTADIHSEANLLKLKFRREQHLLNYMYDQSLDQKMLKAKTKSSVVTQSSSKVLFKSKRPYTEKFKKSLACQGPKKWNALPESFHHAEHKNLYESLVGKLIIEKANKAST